MIGEIDAMCEVQLRTTSHDLLRQKLELEDTLTNLIGDLRDIQDRLSDARQSNQHLIYENNLLRESLKLRDL